MTDLVQKLVGALELCQRALQSQWSPYMRAGEKEAAAMKAAATALSEAKAGGWVAVPVQVLEDASEAIGHFVSDHGWGDSDMQAMDNLYAYIATHKARTAPPAQRGEG